MVLDFAKEVFNNRINPKENYIEVEGYFCFKDLTISKNKSATINLKDIEKEILQNISAEGLIEISDFGDDLL